MVSRDTGVMLTTKSVERRSGQLSDQTGGNHTVAVPCAMRRYSISASDSPTVATRLGCPLRPPIRAMVQ